MSIHEKQNHPQADEKYLRIPTDHFCTEEYEPQTFTNSNSLECSYSNTSYSRPANDAGWTSASDDAITTQKIDECLTVAPNTTHIMALHDPQTFTKDGVDCTCKYDNVCFSAPASNAGWTCISDEPVTNTNTCHRAGQRAHRKCKKCKTDAVLCETDSCEYDNMCLAKKKVFKKRKYAKNLDG